MDVLYKKVDHSASFYTDHSITGAVTKTSVSDMIASGENMCWHSPASAHPASQGCLTGSGSSGHRSARHVAGVRLVRSAQLGGRGPGEHAPRHRTSHTQTRHPGARTLEPELLRKTNCASTTPVSDRSPEAQAETPSRGRRGHRCRDRRRPRSADSVPRGSRALTGLASPRTSPRSRLSVLLRPHHRLPQRAPSRSFLRLGGEGALVTEVTGLPKKEFLKKLSFSHQRLWHLSFRLHRREVARTPAPAAGGRSPLAQGRGTATQPRSQNRPLGCHLKTQWKGYVD